MCVGLSMGLFCGYGCRLDGLSEHQMSVDRKSSQVIIQGSESLSDSRKEGRGGDEDDNRNLC